MFEPIETWNNTETKRVGRSLTCYRGHTAPPSVLAPKEVLPEAVAPLRRREAIAELLADLLFDSSGKVRHRWFI